VPMADAPIRRSPHAGGGIAGSGPSQAPTALERALVDERAQLVGLAYRITGSRVDAEDIVQEAWERARRTDPDAIDRPGAWLTTVVSRLALDHLRASQRRRETYVGPWLPEPVVTEGGRAASVHPGLGADPSHIAELAESLTFGFLRLLEALAPVERAVFVLSDVFGVPFPEIARTVERTPDACRQIAARARRRVRDDGRDHLAPPDAERVADDLTAALAGGEFDRVIELLAPDVVLVSDGGPERHAARRPVVGSDRVGRLVANLGRRGLADGMRIERAHLNGLPGGVVLLPDGTPYMALLVSVSGGRVDALYAVVNPDKVAALAITGPIT
jgi:RNA polymerase sigma-70 factor (ECF subfamily)